MRTKPPTGAKRPSPFGRRWLTAPDEGIGPSVWHDLVTTAGSNPLIRPSGTFSQGEKGTGLLPLRMWAEAMP